MSSLPTCSTRAAAWNKTAIGPFDGSFSLRTKVMRSRNIELALRTQLERGRTRTPWKPTDGSVFHGTGNP